MDMDERFFEPSRNLSSFAIFLISLFLVCAQLNSSAVNSRRDSINELIFRIDEEFGLKPKEIGGELDGRIDRLFEIDAFRIGRCRDVRGPDAPHHIGSSDLAEHGLGVARLAE